MLAQGYQVMVCVAQFRIIGDFLDVVQFLTGSKSAFFHAVFAQQVFPKQTCMRAVMNRGKPVVLLNGPFFRDYRDSCLSHIKVGLGRGTTLARILREAVLSGLFMKP